MKTKIFLPVLAMLSLLLFSFTANANSNNNIVKESTFMNQEIESFESTVFKNSVENLKELEEALRIRITIRLRRVTIIIDIQFSMAGGSGGSGNTGTLEDSQLEGIVEGDHLIVTGFQGVDGSVIEISDNQSFESEAGAYDILPGSYEVNGGKVAFNLNQSRR